MRMIATCPNCQAVWDIDRDPPACTCVECPDEWTLEAEDD